MGRSAGSRPGSGIDLFDARVIDSSLKSPGRLGSCHMGKHSSSSMQQLAKKMKKAKLAKVICFEIYARNVDGPMRPQVTGETIDTIAKFQTKGSGQF